MIFSPLLSTDGVIPEVLCPVLDSSVQDSCPAHEAQDMNIMKGLDHLSDGEKMRP